MRENEHQAKHYRIPAVMSKQHNYKDINTGNLICELLEEIDGMDIDLCDECARKYIILREDKNQQII